jgi:hypothetical protein
MSKEKSGNPEKYSTDLIFIGPAIFKLENFNKSQMKGAKAINSSTYISQTCLPG